MADLARAAGLVVAQLLAHPGAFGLQHAAVEVADDAFERLLHLVGLAAVDEAEGDGAALGAVEDDVLRLLRQLAPRRFEVEVVGAGERAQHLHVIGRGRVGLGPGDDRALLDRERVVGDDEVLVEHQLLAEAVAGGAGALRRVEAEQARLDLGDGEAADRAGELFGEDDAAGGAIVELHARTAARARRAGRRGRDRRGPRRASARSRSCRRGAARCLRGRRCGRPRSRCRACTSCRAPARPRCRGTRRRCGRG